MLGSKKSAFYDVSRPAGRFSMRLEKNVPVQARDGRTLLMDIYFPEGCAEPMPVLLTRTPYWKDKIRPGNDTLWYLQSRVEYFVSHGYVCAVQDGRGHFGFPIQDFICIKDGVDGYDTIEWLAAQSWSNGRVGMFGCSHGGEMQLYSAKHCPPSLKAMIPGSPAAGTGSAGGNYNGSHEPAGGAFPLSIFKLYVNQGPEILANRPKYLDPITVEQFGSLFAEAEAAAIAWSDFDVDSILHHLPFSELGSITPLPVHEFGEFVRRRQDWTDPWWEQFDFINEGDASSAPALFVDSWHDPVVRDTLHLRGMYETSGIDSVARDNQVAIISPSLHCQSESLTERSHIGPRFIGGKHIDILALELKWFDHWLKGQDEQAESWPKLTYFVLGAGEWRSSDNWPLAETVWKRLYLSSAAGANSIAGDGALHWTPAEAGAASDTFVYDPMQPVLSLGEEHDKPAQFVVDQAPMLGREDVLVFTSQPLASDLEITGPVDAVIALSSSAVDTDVVVKMMEVAPDGTSLNIKEGIRRVRFREGLDRQVFMEPGKIYSVPVNLGATSMVLKAGTRLRLSVTSSSFPRWDRNLNTGRVNCDETEIVVATNTVHHGGEHQSYLVLPTIPE